MKNPIITPIQLLKEKANKEGLMLRIMADLLKIHTDFIQKVNEYKLNKEELDEIISKKVGPQGEKPTAQELLEIIEPLVPKFTKEDVIEAILTLIPPPKNGVTPTTDDLLKIILPLVPKVKDGQTPKKGKDYFTKEEISDIILVASKKVKSEINIPDVIPLIEKLEKKRTGIKDIEGLEQTISAFRNQLANGYLHGGGVPSLTAGSNITLTPKSDGGFIVSSSGGGGGVTSLNTLTGDVSLVEGANITITPSGNDLTISSTGSPPGGADGNIQFNNGGNFAGLDNLYFDTGNIYFAVSQDGSLPDAQGYFKDAGGSSGFTSRINYNPSGTPYGFWTDGSGYFSTRLFGALVEAGTFVGSGGTTGIMIDASGNVAIGTAAFAGLLQVSADTASLGVANLTVAENNVDSFDLYFRKARGGVSVPTVITTADELGVINAQGYSGAGGYVTGAAIKFISSGTIASTRIPAQMEFWTGTNATPSVLTKRLTIDNAGTTNFLNNGALSAPAILANGTWITGGSATTTKPYVLIETSGATSAAWSTSGTGFGVNAASGFVGNLFDFQLNGTSKFKVDNNGIATLASTFLSSGGDIRTSGSGFVMAGSNGFTFASGNITIKAPTDGVMELYDAAGTSFGRLQLGGTTSSFPAIKRSSATIDFRLADDSAYANIAAATITASGSITISSGSSVLTASRGGLSFSANGFMQLFTNGFGVSAGIKVPSDANLNFRNSGDSADASITALTGTFSGNVIVNGASSVIRLKGYTVATLPTGTQGDTAFVTDALAPTFLATIVGGGAVIAPVFYNGTNWVGY